MCANEHFWGRGYILTASPKGPEPEGLDNDQCGVPLAPLVQAGQRRGDGMERQWCQIVQKFKSWISALLASDDGRALYPSEQGASPVKQDQGHLLTGLFFSFFFFWFVFLWAGGRWLKTITNIWHTVVPTKC